MSSALFACTRCNSRHPFDELSQGQQLCKDCRGSFPIVKCTYCRTEFQQETKGNTTTICKKCEQNVKLYGKPTACEYCNIIAAFIGSKCQRCTNSEKKYGPPLTCEQCKQRCAYDRKDDSRKKVDGKLLCWLCTLSYKRALAKAKQNNPIRHSSVSLHKSSGHHRSQNHKNPLNNPDQKSEHAKKKQKLDHSKSANSNGALPSNDSSLMDPNSSDHVVAVTQLREQIALLQKQLAQKDQQLLAKDIQMSELKAHHSGVEKELRLKIQTIQKQHSAQIEELQVKTRGLQKQVATLSKANKKGSLDSPSTT